MNEPQTKIVRGTYMKAAPSGMFAKPHDLHGWASVEVRDRDGDVVMVEGIQTEYPSPIPLVHHKTTHKPNDTADGDLPHVGNVTEWVRTTHPELGVPALAFGADYLRNEDGSLVTKAADTDRRYKLGHLSTFSIAFNPLEEPARNPGGRFVWKKVGLVEISSCVAPSNPFATVMKSLVKNLDAEEMEQLNSLLLSDVLSEQKAIRKSLDEIAEHLSLSDHEPTLPAVQGHEAQRPAINLDIVRKALADAADALK
jgi:hypothetical protein